VALTDKAWHISVGDTVIGSLTPTGADGQWVTATFAPGDGWGNFAPWFSQAYAAFAAGDEAGWQTTYTQLTTMGLAITADDGETYASPTIHIDGTNAWFSA
jgi:hypothetical protein